MFVASRSERVTIVAKKIEDVAPVAPIETVVAPEPSPEAPVATPVAPYWEVEVPGKSWPKIKVFDVGSEAEAIAAFKAAYGIRELGDRVVVTKAEG